MMKVFSTKKGLSNAIYKIISPMTSRLYRDNDWSNVWKLVDAIKEMGCEVSCGTKDGGYRESKDGLNQWKEYTLDIDHNGIHLDGTLTCCAAGTVEDPFDRYDIAAVLW